MSPPRPRPARSIFRSFTHREGNAASSNPAPVARAIAAEDARPIRASRLHSHVQFSAVLSVIDGMVKWSPQSGWRELAWATHSLIRARARRRVPAISPRVAVADGKALPRLHHSPSRLLDRVLSGVTTGAARNDWPGACARPPACTVDGALNGLSDHRRMRERHHPHPMRGSRNLFFALRAWSDLSGELVQCWSI